jgi:hypothetical protein
MNKPSTTADKVKPNREAIVNRRSGVIMLTSRIRSQDSKLGDRGGLYNSYAASRSTPS